MQHRYSNSSLVNQEKESLMKSYVYELTTHFDMFEHQLHPMHFSKNYNLMECMYYIQKTVVPDIHHHHIEH